MGNFPAGGIFPGVFFPRTVIKNYFATVDKFLKFSQETNLKFSKHFHYQLQWWDFYIKL